MQRPNQASFFVLFGWALLNTGCATPSPPPPARALLPVEWTATATHYAGTPLSGPLGARGTDATHSDERQTAEADSSGAEASERSDGSQWFARVHVTALERFPTAEMPKLATRLRLVADPADAEPLVAIAPVARGGSVATGELALQLGEQVSTGQAGRTKAVGTWTGALAEGTTWAVCLAADEATPEPENFLREYPELGVAEKSLTVAVGRSEDTATIALTARAVVPPRAGRDIDPDEAPTPGTRPPGAPRLLRELLVLEDAPEFGGDPIALVLPSPFVESAAAAFLISIEVAGPFEDSPPGLIEEAGEQVAANAKAVSLATQTLTPDESNAETLASVLANLREAEAPRSALLYLAESTGALFARDVALAFEEEELSSFVDSASDLLPQSETEAAPVAPPEDLGWRLDRAAYARVADMALRDSASPHVSGVLLRHAGEAGRYPSSLVTALRGATRESFEAFLLEEHFAFLEDASPASRLRAFDWLDARGLAPAHFDPLASRADRRAALQSAESAESQAR